MNPMMTKTSISSTESNKTHHSDKIKSNLFNRLSRVEGQVRGVRAMVEREVYCDDVLNQIAAIHAALNGVEKLILEGHLKNCIYEHIQFGDREVIDEFMVTIRKIMR